MNVSSEAVEFKVVDAVLPSELVLGPSTSRGPCPGDGCNSDQGGCDAGDASCGQDCCT